MMAELPDWGPAEPWHFRFGDTRTGQILELAWAIVMAAGWILVIVEAATLLRAVGGTAIAWSHEQDPRILVPTVLFVIMLVVSHPRFRGSSR